VIKLEMIAYRQGIGDLLTEGSQRAAQRLGRDSEAFLTAVTSMHDPRHMLVMRASYMTAPTGGDHMRQRGNRNGLRNQMALCDFLAHEHDQTLAILNVATGWGAAQKEVVTNSHRGLTLAHLFDLREGSPVPKIGCARGSASRSRSRRGLTRELQGKIVTDYYVEFGWDPRARNRGRCGLPWVDRGQLSRRPPAGFR
jgi:aldehyde:ferredoxin oxidoreductase